MDAEVTEVWFRNPDYFIRECVELNVTRLAWDRGYLVKRAIDPVRLADLYFAPSVNYRMLAIGDQGTAELRRGCGLDKPAAVYPTWEYGQPIDMLEEMLATPVGEDHAACSSKRIPIDERPVLGQEHRVVVIRTPPVTTGVGKAFVRALDALQEEYPQAIVHLHGLYSYRVAFGFSFRSVDIEPRLLAKKGKVTLPSGKEVKFERAAATPQWVRVCGFSPADLSVPRNRCMFNMRSAEWAAAHYKENFKFASTAAGRNKVDPDAKIALPPTTNAVMSRQRPANVGDKFLCDVCSLQDTCKYFRAGSVCSIPDSEPSELIKLFKSRDADQIIEGLAEILAKQIKRVERGLSMEEAMDELDSDVSKALNSVFVNGVKLAKLRDPKLTGAPPLVGINFNVPLEALNRPAALTSAAVKALEAQGVKREDITDEMLTRVLQPALEAGAAPVIDVDEVTE